MSITDPWREDSDALIRTSHVQIVRVIAVTPSAGTFAMSIEPGSTLTVDDEQAPRWVARLVCAAPDTLAQVDALDARQGVRIFISAGYIRPGGAEDVWPVVDLGLRSRAWARPGHTVELVATSDEALVIDAAASVGDTINTSTTAAGIAQILAATITPAPTLYVLTPGPAVAMTPITDRWSAIRDMCERGGVQAYDAGLRAWVCETRPQVAGETSVSLNVGANGIAERVDDSIRREEWHNYVLYRHRWRDANGIDQVITATAYVSDGPYAITGPSGKRIYQEDRDTPTTQTAANAAAADVLSRLVSRGRGVTITGASAWWARPGHTVSVGRHPSAPPERHLIGSITWDLTGDVMTVATRVPTTYTAATTTPAGQAPASDPLPPARTTYVSVWSANSSATYRGDGTKRTDTNNMVQGYTTYATSNGNGQAIALFTAANSLPESGQTGETGQTITQALTGATVIKVEEWVYFEHWNYPSGTARIGRYSGTTLPTTYTAATPTLTSAGWPRTTGRWVDVTAITDLTALAAGTVGLTLGPGVGTDMTYYGRAHGAQDTYPPRRRITYSK